ncbi:hypothetical protein CEXT_391741 [Caerostris extrusa]|uniref:Uncharacterized protein n=1 Tax=Caerostris extrusa TaxID=172846 RepID=A0AAV4UEN7_CAEEX|nr:hypothetical protein CEXT_391741 [Caerostris extrusa]
MSLERQPSAAMASWPLQGRLLCRIRNNLPNGGIFEAILKMQFNLEFFGRKCSLLEVRALPLSEYSELYQQVSPLESISFAFSRLYLCKDH